MHEINHNSCLETICEYNQKTISCGEGEMIEILAVFRGRNDRTTCLNNWIPLSETTSTTCKSTDDFLYKIASYCDGERSCNLYAHFLYLGDPCKDVSKYLKVKYKCMKEGKVFLH